MPETTQSAEIARVAETTRSARIDVTKVAPEAYQAMAGLGRYVRDSGLEPSLLNLIYMRSSQINGCAYCLDMHSKKPAPRVKPSSVFMSSALGARRRSTLTANAPRWPGLKP